MYVYTIWCIVGGDEFVWPEEAGLPFSSDPNDPSRLQYVVCIFLMFT